jgi:branched-chain amino acid transport system ATP-binding protein
VVLYQRGQKRDNEDVIMLEVIGVCKDFGGLRAVNNVSFQVEEGELSSIIGPNGAGKTTLFHVISGYYRADRGKVLFMGEDITNMPAWAICRKGLCRSFQIVDIFPRLSVFRNVQIAVMARQGKTKSWFSSSNNMARDEVERLICEVGLKGQEDSISGSLSSGDQKRLEIAIALASHPKLLLLDEPTAGMSPVERSSTVELIQRLAKDRGLTTLFTEHDMDVVFGISDKIRVMHMGKIVAEGNPAEIRGNELVQKVYLGELV